MRYLPLPRRRPAQLLTALALTAGLLAAAEPADLPLPGSAPLHPIAGEVTIEAPAGLSGIRFALPEMPPPSEGVRLDNSLSTVDELYEGEFALVQMVLPRYTGAFCDPESFCTFHYLEVVPDWYAQEELPENNGLMIPHNSCTNDTPDGGHIPCPLRTEVLDVYIAADAPLSFTLRFPELDGTVAYTATDAVEGVYEEVPTVECPGGDCDRFEVGYSVRTMGSEHTRAGVRGFAYVRAAYGRYRDDVPATVNRTSNSGVMGCTYPSLFVPDGSADPDDHPTGCDLHPTVTEEGGIQDDPFTIDSYVFNTDNQARGNRPWWNDINGTDPVYFGFNARNHNLVPGFGGAQNAWAVWLEQGID